MKTLSILGAGWLGLELAQTLRKTFDIRLSARDDLSQKKHTDLGFESYVLTEGTYDNLDTLLSCNYLFINFPPRKFENYLQFITKIFEYPALSNIEYIIFVSSSSIYPKDPSVYYENSIISSPSNPLYYEVEQYTHGKVHLIFRCAGIMGGDRIAGKYYSDKLVKDGNSRVNHVHRIDVIRAIFFAIEHSLKGIFNLCAPSHPTKRELYIHQSGHFDFIAPRFIVERAQIQRIIDGHKIEKLGFNYIHRDPIDFT